MFLAEITDSYHNTGSNKLAEQCIHVQQLYKKFQQQVIEKKIKAECYKITEYLYPAFEVGVNKNHKLHQHKTHYKIYTEGNKQRCNMWLKGKEPEIEIFFFKNILVTDEVNK